MNQEEMKERTREFALRVLRVVAALPETTEGKVIGYQLGKSGTSVGANYRSACRGRSKAEFISKLDVVLEEADESSFWLDIVLASEMMSAKRIKPLYDESEENRRHDHGFDQNGQASQRLVQSGITTILWSVGVLQ